MPDSLPPPHATAHAAQKPAHTPALAPLPNTGARPRYISEHLFGEHTEVEIQHGEFTYRLRLTSLGKLILTK